MSSTICAAATPAGGALAIIRLSGPQAIDILASIWQGKDPRRWQSHTAHLGTLVDPLCPDDPIDEVMATVMLAPGSFTGEDTVEVSVHGSPYIRRALLQLLVRQGCRMAQPGEFSRRAFANGRIDLTRAEAVADVIASTSRASHRLAHQQMRGTFSRRLSSLGDSLLQLASLMELELDFSEEDVEFADRSRLTAIASETLAEVDRLAASFSTGRAIREGIPVAIVGAPNVGKSSLLNRLLGDDRAIVSDLPGTTRDTVEDTAEISGLTFRFIDTAGLRDDPADLVESLGIARSRAQIGRARIVLLVVSADTLGATALGQETPLLEVAGIKEVANSLAPDSRLVVVVNKADLLPHLESCEIKGIDPAASDVTVIAVSAKTGLGIEDLQQLLSRIALGDAEADTDVTITNLRHYEALRGASASLGRLIDALTCGLPTDLAAQDLREALHHLSSITGSITSPDILHNIFKNFCVGK